VQQQVVEELTDEELKTVVGATLVDFTNAVSHDKTTQAIFAGGAVSTATTGRENAGSNKGGG